MLYNSIIRCAIIFFGLYTAISHTTDDDDIINNNNRHYFPKNLNAMHQKYANEYTMVQIIQKSDEYGAPRWHLTYQSRIKKLLRCTTISQTALKPYWHRPTPGVPNWLGEIAWRIAPCSIKKRISCHYDAPPSIIHNYTQTPATLSPPPHLSIPQYRIHNNTTQSVSGSLDGNEQQDDLDNNCNAESISESSTVSTSSSNALQP